MRTPTGMADAFRGSLNDRYWPIADIQGYPLHRLGGADILLLRSLSVSRSEFEAATGWRLKPEGACQGNVCIPLSRPAGDTIDVARVANDIGMPLVAAPEHGLWALGPASIGSRALASAQAPDLRLPDLNGKEFRLSSLRGQKVLLYAWAPY